jgi:hypothetical protein
MRLCSTLHQSPSQIPEIVTSDEFLIFLDSESPDGEAVPVQDSTEVDILVAGQEEHQKVSDSNCSLSTW